MHCIKSSRAIHFVILMLRMVGIIPVAMLEHPPKTKSCALQDYSFVHGLAKRVYHWNMKNYIHEESKRINLCSLAVVSRRIKATNQKGQTKWDKRSQICRISQILLIFEIIAFGRRRLSHICAGNRRFSQKTRGTKNPPVPSSSSLPIPP